MIRYIHTHVAVTKYLLPAVSTKSSGGTSRIKGARSSGLIPLIRLQYVHACMHMEVCKWMRMHVCQDCKCVWIIFYGDRSFPLMPLIRLQYVHACIWKYASMYVQIVNVYALLCMVFVLFVDETAICTCMHMEVCKYVCPNCKCICVALYGVRSFPLMPWIRIYMCLCTCMCIILYVMQMYICMHKRVSPTCMHACMHAYTYI
jgi:hypothetical protein